MFLTLHRASSIATHFRGRKTPLTSSHACSPSPPPPPRRPRVAPAFAWLDWVRLTTTSHFDANKSRFLSRPTVRGAIVTDLMAPDSTHQITKTTGRIEGAHTVMVAGAV